MDKAVVIFSPEGSHPLRGFLRSGFKHVAVAVQEPGGPWILVDCDDVPHLKVIGMDGFDVAGFYREMGLVAIEVDRPCDPPRWPLTVSNCVGIVKVVLGLRAPWVITPYALYRRLTK